MMNGKEGGILQPAGEGYDPKVESKKNQKYKAAPGVKFVEFDEFGMNKAEGLGQFISTDNKIADVFIEAPKEMMEKAMMRPIGVFRDFDRDAKTLTNEGKSIPFSYTGSLTLVACRKGSLRLPSGLRPRLRCLGGT